MRKTGISLACIVLLVGGACPAWASSMMGIQQFTGSSRLEANLASKELQRYLYLRTGELVEPVKQLDGSGIYLGTKEHPAGCADPRIADLGEQDFLLVTQGEGDAKQLFIIGGSDLSMLYGVYRFCEHLGIRFNLHGDVIPEERMSLSIPDLDELSRPLFERRGIQPFHDFPEGPDWWQADDYKAYFTQMVKMRMNFAGFHCYPESRPTKRGKITRGLSPAEPLIWLGVEEDIGENGEVKSSYETFWANTSASGKWGYARVKTSDFAAGAGLLFDRDYYGHDLYEYTEENLRPLAENGYTFYDDQPATAEEMESYNATFKETADFLNDTFSYGRELGIKMAIGTQAALKIPKELDRRLKSMGKDYTKNREEVVREIYRGSFKRIADTYPIDFYWLWTNEGWLNVKANSRSVTDVTADMQIAYDELQKMGNPFKLATAGWVLGPIDNSAYFDDKLPKDVPFSCINRKIGFYFVDRNFGTVENREKWAIPWIEDDAAMNSPQFWAGRIRKDAADALALGCNGLMGIHWRTRVLGPNFAALMTAGWDQSGWNPTLGQTLKPASYEALSEYRMGGSEAGYEETHVEPVYKTVAWALEGYQLDVPEGTYDVKLHFAEHYFREPGQRIFDVAVNGGKVADGVDILKEAGFGKGFVLTVPDVEIKDRKLVITFDAIKDNPAICGIEIDGMTAAFNQFAARPFHRGINCGGEEIPGFEKDLGTMTVARKKVCEDRDLDSMDLYEDWCLSEFGSEIAREAAIIFNSIDGGKGDYSENKNFPDRVASLNIPQQSSWKGGPGGIRTQTGDKEHELSQYTFIDELEALRPRIKSKASLERFDYWLSNFYYIRTAAEASCVRKELLAKIATTGKLTGAKRKSEAEKALEMRIELAQLWHTMITHLVDTVDTPGEMGTIANMEQHILLNPLYPSERFLASHDRQLEKLLGHALPAEATPSKAFTARSRIVVPTKRTHVTPGERITLKAVVLDKAPATSMELRYRFAGEAKWTSVPFEHLARNTYQVLLPAVDDGILEYAITAETKSGDQLFWPATAPDFGHTLIRR